MAQQMVTFNTVLDTARETPKAIKIFNGSYYPKSQVTFDVLEPVQMRDGRVGGRRSIPRTCHIVTITMPKWLNEKG